MGYRRSGHSSLALQGILDPDRITSVSKDAILAYVECQIMKQIWENLSALYQITWFEILEFRETHIGTPDQVISSLTHRYYQKRYNEKFYQIQPVDNDLTPSECLFRHNSLAYFNHSQYPGHSYSVPAQTRYGPVVSSQQAISSSALYPSSLHSSYVSSHHSIKPHDIYSINGHHRHNHYPSQMNLPSYAANGYSLESMMYPTTSVVPTGQLIELDASPTYNGSDQYFHRTISSKYNCPPEELLHLQNMAKNDEPSLSGKAKDDGAGSWENWDYVYRNLESHGYKKNYEGAGELPLKGTQQSSSQNNSSEIDVDSMIQTDFSDKMRKINLDRTARIESNSSKSCSDNSDELKSKITKEKTKVDPDKSRESSKIKPENKSSKISPEKCKKESTGTSTDSNVINNVIYAKVNVNQKRENNSQSLVKDSIKFRKSREDVKPLVVNLNDEEEKWQCVTCTYLNSVANNVCEMCCKSKERGNEINPQPTGGQECHKCTLVNKPGVSYCSACNTYLKDSPTYI